MFPGRTRRLALIEGVAAGILFGTASILIRFLNEINSFSIAFWRLTIAAAALTVILMMLRKTREIRAFFDNFKDLIVLSVFLGLHFILFASAVKDTAILNATVFVNTTPIFSMLISSFLFRVKPSRLAILGLTISFTGAFIIAYAETYHNGFSPHLKGDLEAVLAALAEAFYLNFGRKTRSRMTLLSAMLPISLLAAVFVGFTSVSTGNKLTLPLKLEVLVPLMGLGLLPTAIAHTLYFSSLSNLKSFETATMALLEPIGATLLAVFIFQEIPAAIFVLGAILILVGILFVAMRES